MIRVRKLVGRLPGSESLQLSGNGISGVTIATRDLERSVHFYSRVFGFGVAGQGSSAPRRSATLAGPGAARLAIREQGEGTRRTLPLHSRWGFLVDDLDGARATAWDLGVKVAEDNGAPDHIRRWPNGRSLRVRDPDGNEIELVEECREHAAPRRRRRCPAGRAWHRWVHPSSCTAP